MRFNANRLAALAGIPTDSSRGRLDESGNQSRHSEGHDEGYDWYKGDLNEQDDNPFMEPEESLSAEDEEALEDLDPGEDVYEEADFPSDEEMFELEDMGEDGDDEIVEINETMLSKEISRMRRERSRRANSRTHLHEEQKLRNAIRNEISSIVGNLNDKDHLYTTRNWLYGDKKPRNSRPGYVARGGFGIGF